ncbi:hypothetical protein BD410DRAFT_841682 [Rickenella mellea]|uniref:Uncharacterized protein n=1 Tax=Rickenella mellea TaxID=50990 RepID=A0A4Y7PWX6_9AGAM|nr:hypothetical protein BD410DRAFT_841682 [Rickenella mellea]
MSSAGSIRSCCATIKAFVLAWTPYASIAKASEPQDYECLLKRISHEVKFHCETLLAMLFFMGTTMDNGPLISWTLACLLYSLITLSTLDAMTSDSLPIRLNDVPAGRLIFAILAKLPALSVIATLCALALTSWDSVFTAAVMVLVVCALLLTLAIRLHAYMLAEQVWHFFKYLLRKDKVATAKSLHPAMDMPRPPVDV